MSRGCQTAAVPTQELADFVAFYGARGAWSLVVAIAAIVVARALRGVTMRALQRSRAHSNAIILLGNFAQIGVLIVGALVVLAIFTGPNFGWILTSFSVIGLVIGLSLQDLLKNFFAGVWILVERPFRFGDTIQVDAHTGVVEQIAFRTTLLRTLDGRQVVIPNNTLMTSMVVNHSAYPLRRAGLWLVLAETELAKDTAGAVSSALRDAPVISSDPAPRVELRSVSDGRARFLVTFWAPEREGAVPEAIAAVRARFPGAEVHDA